MTTRANSQFPRPDFHRQDKQPYGLRATVGSRFPCSAIIQDPQRFVMCRITCGAGLRYNVSGHLKDMERASTLIGRLRAGDGSIDLEGLACAAWAQAVGKKIAARTRPARRGAAARRSTPSS